MDFDLSEELTALQATCRKIAQEKVKPRAREIDETGEYPQDLFEVFRDAGLLGLCIPEDLGGGGAGILGLTLAIEEVSKYSNTAALMLLLTRLPTGPVMIAGPRLQADDPNTPGVEALVRALDPLARSADPWPPIGWDVVVEALLFVGDAVRVRGVLEPALVGGAPASYRDAPATVLRSRGIIELERV